MQIQQLEPRNFRIGKILTWAMKLPYRQNLHFSELHFRMNIYIICIYICIYLEKDRYIYIYISAVSNLKTKSHEFTRSPTLNWKFLPSVIYIYNIHVREFTPTQQSSMDPFQQQIARWPWHAGPMHSVFMHYQSSIRIAATVPCFNESHWLAIIVFTGECGKQCMIHPHAFQCMHACHPKIYM